MEFDGDNDFLWGHIFKIFKKLNRPEEAIE